MELGALVVMVLRRLRPPGWGWGWGKELRRGCQERTKNSATDHSSGLGLGSRVRVRVSREAHRSPPTSSCEPSRSWGGESGGTLGTPSTTVQLAWLGDGLGLGFGSSVVWCGAWCVVRGAVHGA